MFSLPDGYLLVLARLIMILHLLRILCPVGFTVVSVGSSRLDSFIVRSGADCGEVMIGK
jgi:hypothetical protein